MLGFDLLKLLAIPAPTETAARAMADGPDPGQAFMREVEIAGCEGKKPTKKETAESADESALSLASCLFTPPPAPPEGSAWPTESDRWPDTLASEPVQQLTRTDWESPAPDAPGLRGRATTIAPNLPPVVAVARPDHPVQVPVQASVAAGGQIERPPVAGETMPEAPIRTASVAPTEGIVHIERVARSSDKAGAAARRPNAEFGAVEQALHSDENPAPLRIGSERILTEPRAPEPAQPRLTTAPTAEVTFHLETRTRTEKGEVVEIRLDPPELGRLRVVFHHDATAPHAQVIAERSDIAELIRRHAPQLEQSFRDAGFRDVAFSFHHGERRGDGQGRTAEDYEPTEAVTPEAFPVRVAALTKLQLNLRV